MNEPWEIQLLGGLRVRRGGRDDVRFPTQRVAGMLARLAYRPGETISREELVDILWPDCLLHKGLPRLSGELTRLRNLLEPLGDVDRGSVLRADNVNISLNPAAVTTDLATFENAHKNGLESSSTAARLPWLVQAVETYRGPLLPRFDHAWIEPARRGAAERFLQATEQLTAQLSQIGEHDRAVTYARRAVAMNARSEDAHCLLLRVLVRANRLPEMRQRYRELERMLEDNYGSVP
ncbi:MAG: hypothetical protein H7145_09515, partial [Akkermansiaceae bacterium]|nr:hypothetical protein [Armatimonadota bacterium]